MARNTTIYDLMRSKPMDEATKKWRLELVRRLMQLSPKDRVIALRLAAVKTKMKLLAMGPATRLIIKADRGSKMTTALLASIQQKSKKTEHSVKDKP